MKTGARMVDVGQKPLVDRVAEAQGRLRLRAATVDAIRDG
ncbi:MAG: cyclic pyranopterin monophosphate synthase MoaC, partial [Euryarchaeota archaeon]|nr:cyclic pyranopterin monophosphate synthase MoaC [Euryarchaeota archaeon]